MWCIFFFLKDNFILKNSNAANSTLTSYMQYTARQHAHSVEVHESCAVWPRMYNLKIKVPLGHYEHEFACLRWRGGGVVVYIMYRTWRLLVKNFHRMLKCILRKHNSDVASKYCILLISNIQGSHVYSFFFLLDWPADNDVAYVIHLMCQIPNIISLGTPLKIYCLSHASPYTYV